MSRFSLRRVFAFAALSLVVSAAGCKDLADALTAPTTPDQTVSSSTSTITFWTTDPSPSSISVLVDGTAVGVLSAYRTVAPTCGANTTGGTLTVTVSPGSHTISAREITSTGVWAPASVTVSAGGCLSYVFNG